MTDQTDQRKTSLCKCRNPGHPNCTGSRSHVDQEGAPSARKYLRSRPSLRWYSCGLWVVNESRPVCLIIWQNFAEEVPCPTFLDWHIWSLQFCFFKLVSSSTCSNCTHLRNSPSLRYYQIDLCESPCSWRWAWPVPLNCHEFTRMQPHRSWALANGGRRPWESLIIVGFFRFFSSRMFSVHFFFDIVVQYYINYILMSLARMSFDFWSNSSPDLVLWSFKWITLDLDLHVTILYRQYVHKTHKTSHSLQYQVSAVAGGWPCRPHTSCGQWT